MKDTSENVSISLGTAVYTLFYRLELSSVGARFRKKPFGGICELLSGVELSTKVNQTKGQCLMILDSICAHCSPFSKRNYKVQKNSGSSVISRML